MSTIKKIVYYYTDEENGAFEEENEGKVFTTLRVYCKFPIDDFSMNRESKWQKCLSPFAIMQPDPCNQFLSYWGLQPVFTITGVKDEAFDIDQELTKLKDKEFVQSCVKLQNTADFDAENLPQQDIEKLQGELLERAKEFSQSVAELAVPIRLGICAILTT